MLSASSSFMFIHWPARIHVTSLGGNGANDEDSLIIDGFAMPGPSAKVSLGVMIILPPVHRVRGALPAVEPPIAPSVCKEIMGMARMTRTV